MQVTQPNQSRQVPSVVFADGDLAIFNPGDRVLVDDRDPVCHYRVPRYLRGKVGTVEQVISPTAVNNEAEGYGRNAGMKRHYYRLAVPLSDIWSDYGGSAKDALRIEVYETWLERM